MRDAARDDQFIGRERERAELAGALASAQAGRGGLFLLAGEAGVGKTRLAQVVLADSRLLALVGAASQELVLPYGPIVAALRAYLRAVPDGLRDCGPLAGYLSLLLPELGPAPASGDPPTIFAAICSAFTAIARRQPAAVVLDDLQWADRTTLDLLPTLDGALAQEPLLLIGIYRSDEITRSHPLRRLRADLRRAGQLRERQIEPLDPAETAALAARASGAQLSPTLAATIFDRTYGLPFFVEELAAALAAGGRLLQSAAGLELAADADIAIPDTVRDAVLLRVDALSEQARYALEIAAVAGVSFDFDLIAGLAGGEAGLEQAIEHGLIVEAAPGRGAFRHALLREALYGDIIWTRRRALHRQIAAALEACGALPGALVDHWLAGQEPERTRAALRATADSAYAVHAYGDATQALRRALDLWPEAADEAGRLAALDQLAHCAQLSGDLAEAARAWREVADGRRRLGEPRGVAEAARRLATVYELQGALERALAARQAAAEAFAAGGLIGEATAERLAAAAHLHQTAGANAALDLIAAVAQEAELAQRPDLLARALGLEGMLLAELGLL